MIYRTANSSEKCLMSFLQQNSNQEIVLNRVTFPENQRCGRWKDEDEKDAITSSKHSSRNLLALAKNLSNYP